MMQNGSGPDMMTATMPLAAPVQMYSRAQIVEMTNACERDHEPLRQRMRDDYSLYRLDPHVNRDSKTGEALEDFAVYTSNMPRVYADKVIAWQSLSELLVRAPHVESGSHKEETDNLKEMFAIGLLRQADERLKRLLQPSLRNQLATFATVRGGYLLGRCLLARRPDGSTYADVTAWDPMHAHWGLGQDGLEWACYKIKKTRAQIRAEYGYEAASALFPTARGAAGSSSTNAEQSGVWVYDWYDAMFNTVVTDGVTLKPPTLHGSPRTPVYAALVGPAPVLQSEAASNLIRDVGESVFSAIRDIADKHNDINSIMLELVARARRQTVVTESADGRKTLPADPFVQGTEISTRTGDKIYTLDLQRMAQESGIYMQMVSGDYQRGTLPYSTYGDTQFQLSGFAITQLRQATETVLASRIEALESVYLQIANLLYDQFMTGAFEGVRLSGMDSHRQYFNRQMTRQEIADACDYTVTLKSQLPQDEAGKWSIAKIAKDGQFLSDEDILNNILGIQDAQQSVDKVMLQRAQQGLPEAILYTLMMAAADRGEIQIARLYLAEYQRLMAIKMGVLPPDGASPDGKPGGKPAGQKGLPPEVQPNAMTGAAPQPETSNNGPSYVAPETPRPGAQGQKA